MTSEQALKWLYAGHLYEVAKEKESDLVGRDEHEDHYCGFCAVIRDSIGLSVFEELSQEELTGGMHPLMHYLLENSPPKEDK